MSIKIPVYQPPKLFNHKNVVKQMASDGFLPVIALEAFVEGGRTYQAYKRGGFDEARERITEEFSGAVFWLGGVTALNWLFEKLGQKVLKLPNKAVDITKDNVRNPLANYLAGEQTKDGAKILEKTIAKFKFAKVISSVLIANAFIGFALPKINQAITRSYHKKDDKKAVNAQSADKFIKQPTLDSFVNNKKINDNKTPNKDKKDVTFGMNLLAIANKFESDRNYKLLSVDAGTATGRAYSARNNDERVEILFRDLSSIYFYMFNMNNLNNWLNKLEQNGKSTRLDPVSADYATKFMQNYLDTKDSKKASVEEFAKEILGKNENIPESLKSKFQGEGIKIINLDDFKQELKTLVSPENLQAFEETAEKMSKLQPELLGKSILTEGQVKDILNGGHINNPEFLQNFFKFRFGEKFMEKYSYVAQKDLDNVKQELIDYVQSIIETAKKTNATEITETMLKKASSSNFKMNALNWGAGFVTSALFLSTLIPKMQYYITKMRTGTDSFPGTQEFNNK